LKMERFGNTYIRKEACSYMNTETSKKEQK